MTHPNIVAGEPLGNETIRLRPMMTLVLASALTTALLLAAVKSADLPVHSENFVSQHFHKFTVMC